MSARNIYVAEKDTEVWRDIDVWCEEHSVSLSSFLAMLLRRFLEAKDANVPESEFPSAVTREFHRIHSRLDAVDTQVRRALWHLGLSEDRVRAEDSAPAQVTRDAEGTRTFIRQWICHACQSGRHSGCVGSTVYIPNARQRCDCRSSSSCGGNADRFVGNAGNG